MSSDKTMSRHLGVELERIKILYEHIHRGSFSYYAWVASLLAILTLSGSALTGMIIWTVAAVIVHLIKEAIVRNFLARTTIVAPDVWERHMVVASFFEGLTVSAGAMLLLNLDIRIAVYLAAVLLLLPGFASALVLVSSIRSHYAWMLAMFLPIITILGTSHDPYYWILAGIASVGGMPASALIAKHLHEEFVRTLRLRSENHDLLVQLRLEKHRAEKASEDKSHFLASASHDLRQPVHALKLFAGALENKLDQTAQIELMGKMKESIEAMNDLLSSLLDISRLDAHLIKIDKRPLCLKTVLTKLSETFQNEAKKKGLLFHCEHPACAVLSDVVLLESILQNLLSNAIKYTQTGSIEIRCQIAAGKVRISVADTGIGIAPADRENIFNEFFQAHNPERDRSKGLGLGLAIVKRTCGLLEHKLEVKSELGQGTIFTVELDEAAVPDVEQLEPLAPITQHLNATVLVIDDERAILEGMEKLLGSWGCIVLTATSQQQALSLLKHHTDPIDLIIADYRLREGSLGTEAIAAIHQALANDKIPAIIITGDTGPTQLLDIQASGWPRLYKPVSPVRIRALMQNLLKSVEDSK